MCVYFVLSMAVLGLICLHAVLHPAYKTAYFERQKWPEEWIKTAITLMREHYNMYYKPTDVEEVEQEVQVCCTPFRGF